jgi:hypothetical protein
MQGPNPTNYQKLQGNNPDGSRNSTYPVLFDKLDYIDYYLLNLWGGNWDWPDKNYWIGRKRTGDSTGFKCYPWDIEGIVDDAESSLNMVSPRGTDAAGVGLPHHYLKNFPEYQLDFADRVQKFLFDGGLLTSAVLTNRFAQLASQVESAILAESARWGNGNLSVQSLSTWRRERDYILNTYLKQRTAIVLTQLKQQGLYPSVAAPAFSQFGGTVPRGYKLALTIAGNGGGTIWFTLDGSDPRVYASSAVASTAQAYSAPLTLNSLVMVRARVLQGSHWSALEEAMFYLTQDLNRLDLDAMMYHPAAGSNALVLGFGAVSNRSYSLEWSTLVPTVTWNRLVDVPAQPRDRLVTVTNWNLPEPSRFFRLVTPVLP